MRFSNVVLLDLLLQLHFGKGLTESDDGLQLTHGDGNMALTTMISVVTLGFRFLSILDVEVLDHLSGFVGEARRW